MRKTNVFLIIGLALALMASLTLNQFTTAFAQGSEPVGIVVAYVPGDSITIVDHSGNQQQYAISTSLKILPPGRASSLAIGSFVTIIAPASIDNNKQTAVGIVVHPHVPNGWSVPSASATPLTTSTALATFTATPTGTQLATNTATETSTATATTTGTALPTETATATDTPTAVGTATDTPTATPTPPGGTSAISTNALIDWLRSLLRQVLSGQ